MYRQRSFITVTIAVQRFKIMTLSELLKAVKEQNLDRIQLEAYREELLDIFNRMHEELSDIEKKEALYMNREPEKSVARLKIEWKACKEGQRQIELKHYVISVSKILDSLRNRIYRFI